MGVLRSGISSLARFVRATPVERRDKVRARLSQQYWTEQRELLKWKRMRSSGAIWGLSQKRETFVYALADEVVGKEVAVRGDFQFSKFADALHALRRERVGTLVYVGANIGVTYIPAVSQGLARRAIAIEPDPLNFRLLACNVGLNGLEKSITCINAAAVGDDRSEVLMERSSTNFGDHRVVSQQGLRPSRGELVNIASARLDQMVGCLDPETDLIWIDVQGYEVEVLQGARSLLEAGVPLVLEFWPYGLAEHDSQSALPEVLCEYGAFLDLSQLQKGWRPVMELFDLMSEYGFNGMFTDIVVRR